MARKNPKNPDATRPLSCVLYIRVSTKLQVEKGESIDAQRFELTRYAEAHGMRVLGEYVDAGFSGKNVRGRPQFRQMLDDIIKEQPGRRPTYVLVFKLSRFGRNAADTWNSLQMLQDYGVELCCVKDGIDSATTMGKAMLSIAAVFAEMERDNIRTQTMSGREEKARKGYWNGGQAPYGYRLVDRGGKFKELVVDEDEAKVVRRIFKMYAYENKGPMAIASWLNRHGVTKAARGNATMETFGNTTIARMVVNPVYIGKIAYGRRRTEVIEGTRGETHVVKSDGYEVYDGRHEAIIDEATWAERQEVRRRAREPAERAARVPGVRAQDVLAPEPGKGQEGRHAGKDHLRVLLPAHVEGAWGDLHLQTPVPAGVRGCRGRRDGEAGVAFGRVRGGAAPPHQRRDRRGAAARGRRAHRARAGG